MYMALKMYVLSKCVNGKWQLSFKVDYPKLWMSGRLCCFYPKKKMLNNDENFRTGVGWMKGMDRGCDRRYLWVWQTPPETRRHRWTFFSHHPNQLGVENILFRHYFLVSLQTNFNTVWQHKRNVINIDHKKIMLRIFTLRSLWN